MKNDGMTAEKLDNVGAVAVLGLDPATTTGWVAIGHDCSVLHHGAYDMRVGRHESQGMAFLRFEKWFRELLNMTKPCIVAFEEVPSHRGVHAAHRYGAIVAHIMRISEELGFPYCGIPIGTWKRLATGRGNASKDDVAESFMRNVHPCTERPGWTQDEIDAYFIAMAAYKEIT